MKSSLLAIALLVAAPFTARAQYSAPPNTAQTFKDTSMLKPPAGSKVAIYDFEDLECPACAHAFPITHAAVDHYHIPLVRHDFPLRMHIWSFDGAVIARYIQDRISPEAAEEYRRSVFANQTSIATKEDLQDFTRKYFQAHGREMPFVVDPQGTFANEVRADYNLGERLGLTQTPTIFVVTPKAWIQVTDVSQLYNAIDTAIANTGGPEAERASAKPHHAAKTLRKQ